MEQIAPGVFVETGYRMVNVGAIVTEAGVICIDCPPYPADARHWRSHAQQLHPRGLLYLVNTDYHRDRVLGDSWMDVPVIAHQVTGEKLRSYGDNFPQVFVDALASRDPEAADDLNRAGVVIPEIAYERQLSLHWGSRVIQLLHRPGPTPGSTWVYLPAEHVLFCGASVVIERHPNLTEADTRQWLAILDELRLEYSDARLVPGRGPVTDGSGVEPLVRYLRRVRNRVSELHAAGRPKTDTAGLVPEFLALFPILEDTRDRTQRRIKAGLDRVYDELRNGEKR